MKNDENETSESNKEIIFFLGIYFSISKPRQEKYFNEIIPLFEKKNLFEHIKKYAKSVTSKNQIFYLFSSLNYTQFSLNNDNEEEILNVPRDYLINYIKENIKGINNANLEQNIFYMEEYYQFSKFSPKRDQILRKLFFIGDKNAVNNLRLICC